MAKKRATKKVVEKPTRKPRTKEVKELSDIPEAVITDNQTLKDAMMIACEGLSVRRLTCIADLLNDRDTLISIAEKAAAGASIDTISMMVGLDKTILKQWLKIGEKERQGPYRAFYEFYLKASAEARIAAEASLLIKNPAAWLDRCEALKQIEEYEPTEAEPQLPGERLPMVPLSSGIEGDDDEDEANTNNVPIPDGYGQMDFTQGD